MRYYRKLFCTILLALLCTLCAGSLQITGAALLKTSSPQSESSSKVIPVGGNSSSSSSAPSDSDVSEPEDSSSLSKPTGDSETVPSVIESSSSGGSSSISPPPSSEPPSSSSKPSTVPPSSSAPPSSSSSSPPSTSEGLQAITVSTSITGTPQMSSSQLVAAYKILSGNKTPLLTCSLSALASYYIDYGRAENIRGDIAFFQACHETGFFQYGGDVAYTQNNFAGMGAVGGGEPGVSYDTASEGVLGHIQHLKCYANNDPYNLPLIDKRYWSALRGTAPTWGALSGTWASDATYGTKIVTMYNKAIAVLG